MNEKEIELSIIGINKGYDTIRYKTIDKKDISIKKKIQLIDNAFKGYCKAIREIFN